MPQRRFNAEDPYYPGQRAGTRIEGPRITYFTGAPARFEIALRLMEKVVGKDGPFHAHKPCEDMFKLCLKNADSILSAYNEVIE